jgi:hypothetical protein
VPSLSKKAIFQIILDRMKFFDMITTTKIKVSGKYEGGKTVSQHDKGTTALKYPSGVRYSL